jgi:RHS repeat-associated protein
MVRSGLVLSLVLILAFVATMPAQDDANTEQGLKPFGSYQWGDVDQVDLMGGNLKVNIPLVSYPQRGGSLKLDFVLNYFSPGYTITHTCQVHQPCTSVVRSNLNTFPPLPAGMALQASVGITSWASLQIDQARSTSWLVVNMRMPDGASHMFGQTGPTTWRAIDGTGFQFSGTVGSTSVSGIFTGPDGVEYNAGSGGNWVEQDANGNQILNNANTLVDTLGRQIAPSTSTTDFSGCTGSRPITGASLWSIPAAGGGSANMKFCSAAVLITVGSVAGAPGSGQCAMYWTCINAYQSRLQSVVLPNGTAWTFSYSDGLGSLSGITYPTGAAISYSWNTNDACGGQAIHSQVVGRTINLGDGVTLPSTWSYGYTYSQSPTLSVTTVVTDPLLNDSVHVGGNAVSTCSYYETQALYYAGSHSTGTPLKTVNTDYVATSTQLPVLSGGTFSNVPVRTTTIWPNGQQAKQETDYDTGFSWSTITNEPYGTAIYGKPTNSRVYDYATGAPGVLLTTTSTAYKFQSTSTYLANNLLDLPSQISVFAGGYSSGACGANSAAACTTYGYDESGLVSSNISEQKVAGKSSPGNETSVHRWLTGSTVSQSPCGVPVVSNGYLTSSKVYYDTGEVQQSTDPCKYSSSYQYSSTFYGAYLTTTTNALNQITTFGYDFNSGLVTSVKDPNQQPTNKTYDEMSRLTQVTYPDGGTTSYCYTDMGGATCAKSSAPPYSVVTTEAISSSPSVINKITTNVYDGLGRLSQTQLNSDPGGVDYGLITYDALGRKSLVYNPTRCTSITSNCASESTWGYTTMNYDPLGRATSVVEPDGSTIGTSYSAFPCTTVTDEASKSRKSCVDGLGRMTGLWEDPSGLNYETDYVYDALGNLTYVNQKGSNGSSARTRTFVYDSLSHLTSATNPESGTITYAYDADGNVVTKAAPSPNQPSTGTARVTTTYQYDTLNRLTGKSFSDAYTQNPVTPFVTFGYDGVNLTCATPIAFTGTSGTNVIGRRSAMCDSSGNKSWIYDPTGRVQAENDRFIGLVAPYNSSIVFNVNGVQTISANTSYAYYLNGDLQGDSSPAWYEFYTDENGAGQVTTVGDEFYNVLTNATYAPTGQLASAVVGSTGSYNGNAISNTYNNRLQPTLSSASTAGGSLILKLTYNFSLGNGTSGSDNGNVIQITNGKDSNRTQNFLYDSLNRIQQAYTNGPNWGDTYSPTATAPGVAPSSSGIDAWGNLTNISAVTGKTGHESLNCASANTKNQLNTCYTYDAAGNLIKNGTITFIYDAENRLIATSGTSYIYDGDGNRVEKCTQGTTPGTCTSNATGTFYFLHKNGGTLNESDLGGNFKAAYDLIRGRIAARIDLPSTNVHYYFHDRLGTTNIVTDPNGNIQNESDYYPYGGEIPITSSDVNRYKFTGKERDSESGLDMFVARHYGSSLARFLQVDPVTVTPARQVDPQQLNLYAYVRNNPLKLVDPTGMIIDETQLSEKDLEKWQQAEKLAAQKDSNGNLLHPELYNEIVALQQDSRTYTLQGAAGLSSNTAGEFRITQLTADGKDFTAATIKLDFNKVLNGNGVTPADFNLGYSKFGGLNGNARRMAELVGHEFAHGVFSLRNPADAAGNQQLGNDIDRMLNALPMKHRYPLPPDLEQKIDAYHAGLDRSEKYAQQEEKIINGELKASQVNK